MLCMRATCVPDTCGDRKMASHPRTRRIDGPRTRCIDGPRTRRIDGSGTRRIDGC